MTMRGRPIDPSTGSLRVSGKNFLHSINEDIPSTSYSIARIIERSVDGSDDSRNNEQF